MSPVVAYLLALGVGLVVGVVLIEWADARERWRQFEEWDRLDAARDVTGRVGGAQKWES